MAEQTGESLRGLAAAGGSSRRLRVNGRGAQRWSDGIGGGGPVFAGEGQRLPGPAKVPDEVGGEHVEKYVDAHSILGPVMDGTQVQIDALPTAEVSLYSGENAGRSNHAAVPDHVCDPECSLHLDRNLFERGRVCGLAQHHPNRDRTPGPIDEQAVFNAEDPSSHPGSTRAPRARNVPRSPATTTS